MKNVSEPLTVLNIKKGTCGLWGPWPVYEGGGAGEGGREAGGVGEGGRRRGGEGGQKGGGKAEVCGFYNYPTSSPLIEKVRRMDRPTTFTA